MTHAIEVTHVDESTCTVTTGSMEQIFRLARRIDELGMMRSSVQQTRRVPDDRSSEHQYFFYVMSKRSDVLPGLIDISITSSGLEQIQPS